MAIGQPEPPPLIELVDWQALYDGIDNDEDAVIDGIAFPGRWTAIASPAKAGKSTVILGLAVDAAKTGIVTLYMDAEMGRSDVRDRVKDWMHLEPDDLTNLHYTDLPPKLDTVQGAQMLYDTAVALSARLVVIDGLNGVVNGAENEDTTWRDLYEWGIAHLKRLGVAVVSADNLGKAKDAGPRGSSVKLDKADAILKLERTDIGVKLTATHRRSSCYPAELEYRVTDASEEGAPMKVTRIDAGSGWPAGTAELAALLDRLNVAIDASRSQAQAAVRAHDGSGRRADVIGKALKWRRQQAEADFQISTDPPVPLFPGTGGNSGNRYLQPVPNFREQVRGTPAYDPCPAGVYPKEHPPEGTGAEPGTAVFEDPFA